MKHKTSLTSCLVQCLVKQCGDPLVGACPLRVATPEHPEAHPLKERRQGRGGIRRQACGQRGGAEEGGGERGENEGKGGGMNGWYTNRWVLDQSVVGMIAIAMCSYVFTRASRAVCFVMCVYVRTKAAALSGGVVRCMYIYTYYIYLYIYIDIDIYI
jgi:hypothetical protein